MLLFKGSIFTKAFCLISSQLTQTVYFCLFIFAISVSQLLSFFQLLQVAVHPNASFFLLDLHIDHILQPPFEGFMTKIQQLKSSAPVYVGLMCTTSCAILPVLGLSSGVGNPGEDCGPWATVGS